MCLHAVANGNPWGWLGVAGGGLSGVSAGIGASRLARSGSRGATVSKVVETPGGAEDEPGIEELQAHLLRLGDADRDG